MLTIDPKTSWDIQVPFEDGPLNLYQHVPTMYGLYRAYERILREQTARALSQGYPQFLFE